MRIQFLESFESQRGSGAATSSRADTGLFWWTILITMLLGLATFCWFFSIYVFAHPEKPLNYKLLTRLDKLPEVKDFSPTNVPSGKIRSAKDLYGSFYLLSPAHLKVKNNILKRNFIGNYEEEEPVYLTGTFQVLSTRELTEADPVISGWVIRGRCSDFPNVDVEYLISSETGSACPYAAGDTFKITGSGHYASILNIDRFAEEQICFSAVPLLYPELTNIPEEGAEPLKLGMFAPKGLNMESPWPLTSPAVGPEGEVAGLR